MMGHLRLFLDAFRVDFRDDNLQIELQFWQWSGEFMSQRYLIAVERAVRPQLAYRSSSRVSSCGIKSLNGWTHRQGKQ